MDDVHGVADLPDGPAPGNGSERANVVIPAWFGEYQRTHELPGHPAGSGRPGGQRRQSARGSRRAPVLDGQNDRQCHRHWSRPFVPFSPGRETFRGEQFHTVDFPGAEHVRGKRVLVVGGGAKCRAVPRGYPARHRHHLGDPQRAGVARPDRGVRRARCDRPGRGAGPARAGAALGGVRHRHRAAIAGAGSCAPRRLPAAAHVRPDRARRRPLGRRLLRAGRRDPLGHRLQARGGAPGTAGPEDQARRDPAAHFHRRRAERHHGRS